MAENRNINPNTIHMYQITRIVFKMLLVPYFTYHKINIKMSVRVDRLIIRIEYICHFINHDNPDRTHTILLIVATWIKS